MRALHRCRPSSWPLAVLLGALLGLAPPAAVGAPIQVPTDRYFLYQLDNVAKADALEILRTLGYDVLSVGAPGTDESLRRPVVVELPDSRPEVSSLVKETPNLGGNPLEAPTTGQPHQRLLIVWDGSDPQSLESLLGLLRDQIDTRAKQILIEAVVLEIDRDRVEELGVSFTGSKDGRSFAFQSVEGFATPFTFAFERPSVKSLLNLEVKLDALVAKGKASILSQPSIMVLDGRQARIKVGDNIPFTEVASSSFDLGSQIVTSTKYIQTGIMLNLRPRASADDSAVTMQVETLISTPAGPGSVVPQTGALVGPQIRTREVQTLVRVADDTPFIIGGLIAKDERSNRSGLPWLSEIPGLGALFRRTNRSHQQKEVIIVITPHVLPLAERAFRYSVLGKDFENLDHFDLDLFRNLYRIKSQDVPDLDFIYESELFGAMQRAVELFSREFERRVTAAGWSPVAPGERVALADQIRRAMVERPEIVRSLEHDYPGLEVGEPLIQMVSGGVPGEHILVQHMLLSIVEKLDFGRYVDPEAIDFFDAHGRDDFEALDLLEVTPLLPRLQGLGSGCDGWTRGMTFDAGRADIGAQDAEVSFDPPGAMLDTLRLPDKKAYLRELRQRNRLGRRGDWGQLGILLNDCHRVRGRSTLDALRNVLVLKRLIDLNPALPLTLDTFHPGRELVFPSTEDLGARRHVVDRKVAALFYETIDYFHAFEQVYELAYRTIEAMTRPPARKLR